MLLAIILAVLVGFGVYYFAAGGNMDDGGSTTVDVSMPDITPDGE